MQKNLLILSLLILNTLISCNREKRIIPKESCYYQIDTITSILRFTGYYKRKYNLSQNENNALKLSGDKFNLLEISWYNEDTFNNYSELVYKTELRRSLLLFTDYPYEIEYIAEEDSIHIDKLSERNKLLLNFRTELNEIYGLSQKLDFWADSIKKNADATPKTKQDLYQQYVENKHAINRRIDSLVIYVESIDEPNVQMVASIYLLTIRPKEIHNLWNQKKWDKLGLCKNILNETRDYINFREKNNRKLPPFLEKDMNGKIINPDDLKGKYILFDFWASYCGPCIRKSVRWLIPLYNKYNNSGFEIIGVSLDHDLNRWTKTTLDRKLPWININCNEFSSQISYLFNVKEIPRMMLVGKDGNMISDSITIDELKTILEDNDTVY